jgi:hypothetical protein
MSAEELLGDTEMGDTEMADTEMADTKEQALFYR